MLALYHFPRAICAQKVRLALAEKGLDYESRLLSPVDLRSPEYLAINPHGYAPTLLHDGQILTESRVISEYLDDCFPDPGLMPTGALDRARVRLWTKQIDDSLHLNIYVLSYLVSFRLILQALPAEVRERALPLNPVKRFITLDLDKHEASSQFFATAVDRFVELFTDMEAALADNTWLSGDGYSLADTDFTPYVRRLEELGLWQLVRSEYPNVQRWFDAVRARPSYAVALTGWESADDREREARDTERGRPLFEAAMRKITPAPVPTDA